MIVDHMEMAKRIGIKFANNYSKHPNECVAEAYCLVVDFFIEHPELYKQAGEEYMRVLGAFVKRGLRDYFQMWRSVRQLEVIDDTGAAPDTEMLDYLTGLFGNDADGIMVFNLMREGLGYDDISTLAPHLRTAIWDMRTEHANEVRRRRGPDTPEVGDSGQDQEGQRSTESNPAAA